MGRLSLKNRKTGANGGVSAQVLSLMLLLALAVVMWGLGDKLSLYKHTGAAPPMAKAKLLSGRDGSDVREVAVASPSPASLPVLYAALLASFFRILFSQRPTGRAMARAPHRISLWRFRHMPLYRRPPPYQSVPQA